MKEFNDSTGVNGNEDKAAVGVIIPKSLFGW
jgi:hypothetical protein